VRWEEEEAPLPQERLLGEPGIGSPSDKASDRSKRDGWGDGDGNAWICSICGEKKAALASRLKIEVPGRYVE
jgi:hypothetical protein